MSNHTFTVTAEALAVAWWNRAGTPRVTWDEISPCVQEGYVAEAALWLTTATADAEPYCNHDEPAVYEQTMTVCECGAVYGDSDWIEPARV